MPSRFAYSIASRKASRLYPRLGRGKEGGGRQLPAASSRPFRKKEKGAPPAFRFHVKEGREGGPHLRHSLLGRQGLEKGGKWRRGILRPGSTGEEGEKRKGGGQFRLLLLLERPLDRRKEEIGDSLHLVEFVIKRGKALSLSARLGQKREKKRPERFSKRWPRRRREKRKKTVGIAVVKAGDPQKKKKDALSGSLKEKGKKEGTSEDAS